ncbi:MULTISPECIES: HigA family addiction module antitoxin [unclassified Flavobacterium]|jgi:HTH-type transcriptional regulator/antitoxin HigA|uniref:HigA family addiction module antitoxin n=1 Tax=unclassified Flavobacterium TaxID=196869 RepID=UPI0025BC78A0|nr:MULTISPECIES: HigA family addiction module antitoxin [unclassified Flavobacterium]
METRNHIPFIASHPGGLLKDELEARKINQKDFAVEIGMQKTMLNEIIKEKRPVTAETALLLEKTLGISAEYWMRFQSQYELDSARIKQKNIQKIINIDIWKIIKEYVPVNYFRKLSYLVDELTTDIAKIKEMYNINNVDDLVGLSAKQKFSLFRKSDKLKISEKNVLAWNVVAKYEANKQEVNSFNPEKLPDLVQELQTVFFQNKEAVNQVKNKLNQYGIKFILVPKLEQTPIDGYTFWSGDNPAIALTLRHNRIDNFAFTIMHEIGHIDLHLKTDKEQQFFDLTTKSSHLEYIEKEADEFAKESLIPQAIWSKINDPFDFSDSMILKFSTKNKINPAIILGRINHENKQYAISTSIDKKLY